MKKEESFHLLLAETLTSFLHSESHLTHPAPIPPSRSLKINSDSGSQSEMAPVHIDRLGDERIGDRGEAWDGLDIVLSMSSRLARRWQSLIMRSQFVKQEERFEGGWGCWRRVETEWLERSSKTEGLNESFRSRWQYCFVKGRLRSDPNVIMVVCAKADWNSLLQFEPASLLVPKLLKSRVCDILCFFYLWVRRLLIS